MALQLRRRAAAVASGIGRGLKTTAKIAGGVLLAAHAAHTLGKLAWGVHQDMSPMVTHVPHRRESWDYYE